MTNGHGGRRPNAGCKKRGVKRKKTQELMAAVEASGMTPVDYMLSVMGTRQQIRLVVTTW
jgi:hypothetical protein